MNLLNPGKRQGDAWLVRCVCVRVCVSFSYFSLFIITTIFPSLCSVTRLPFAFQSLTLSSSIIFSPIVISSPSRQPHLPFLPVSTHPTLDSIPFLLHFLLPPSTVFSFSHISSPSPQALLPSFFLIFFFSFSLSLPFFEPFLSLPRLT